MKFNIVEVFVNAFKIAWRHKVLWLWQTLPSLAIIFMLPSAFIYYPAFKEIMQGPELSIPIEPWISFSLNLMKSLFVSFFMFFWVLAQIMTTISVSKIEKGEQKISFKKVVQESLSFIFRIFGLYILIVGLYVLVIFVMQQAFLTVYKVFSISAFYFSAFAILVFPATLILLCILQLAHTSIIIDNLGIQASISNSWRFFRANGWNILPIMIILYFGFNLLLGLSLSPIIFLSIPLLLQLTRLPYLNVIFLTVFFGIPFLAFLLIFFIGVLMTFSQSVWTMTYLHMKDTQSLIKPNL